MGNERERWGGGKEVAEGERQGGQRERARERERERERFCRHFLFIRSLH